MITNPEKLLVPAWKKQLDAGLLAMETILEGSIKIRQLQLEAATEAHADIEATRKAVAAATEVAQLIKLQAEWFQSNARKSLAYWRSAYEALVETDTTLAQRACAGATLPLPDAKPVLGMVDSAYQQWLEAAQRFYRPAEEETA